MSPVRSGRGLPGTFEVNDASVMAKRVSGGPAVWSQFGVGAEGAARVFVVGSHASDGRMKSLARDFSFRGLGVDFCNDFEETLNSIAVSPRRWNLLVVGVDHVERTIDIEEIVSELIGFREKFCKIAVVLLSHSFASDDSDLIRSAIADHCFRASVGSASIFAALPQIFANNRSWVLRREEYQKLNWEQNKINSVFPAGGEK